MMKILCPYKVPSFFAGGIPRFILNLYSNNLNNFKNHKITLISINTENNKNNVHKKYNRNLDEVIFSPFLKFKTISFSIKFFAFIVRNAKNYNFIHYQHPDPFSAIAIIIAKLFSKKTKIITTWHADIYKTYLLFAPFLIIIDFILFSLSEKIIYLTPLHLKSSLLGKLPNLLNKKDFIPNGIVLPNKKNTISLKPLKEKKLIKFISVGRLVKYKGLDVALRAIKFLVDKRKDINFQYLIIGSGPEEKSLRSLSCNLGLEKFVKFKGKVNELDKEKFLNESDIYLFPSINQSEAYGLSQLEAISNGLPVINCNLNNGVNYLLPNNLCAITVEKQRPDLIYEAIIKIYDDMNLYFNLSDNGLKRSREFSIERTRLDYSRVFK